MSSNTAPKERAESPHLEFAIRGQLIRWFHERSTKELQAMRKGFEAAQAASDKRKGVRP